MRFIFFLITVLIIIQNTFSAEVRGRVKAKATGEPIAGANVYWINTLSAVSADEKGEFSISDKNISDRILIISFLGYKTDTIKVKGSRFLSIELQASESLLDEVEVKARAAGSHISRIDPIKTEVITQTELEKAACCDLSGCFGHDATVQTATTNVVTNSRELKVLGLSGVYNQVLIDGMPLIRGLSYTYGISSFPGTLIDNIFVSKGANSVLQGYESISGQINVIMKEPEKSERFLLNVYANEYSEKNVNLNFAQKKNRLSNIVSFHSALPGMKKDRDEDGFLDMPLVTRYMFYDKIKFGHDDSSGFSTKTAVRYLWEDRTGGQTNFNPERDKGSTSVYGQTLRLRQPEFYTKTGFRFNDDNKITLIASTFQQNQKSWFGETSYDAYQNNIYSNLQYEWRWDEKNQLKAGISYRYHYLNEKIDFSSNVVDKTYSGNYVINEQVPGVFAENHSAFLNEELSVITGIRIDRHNKYGYFVTPRVFIKYELDEETRLRASVGTGKRTVNIFSENINLLASGRDIVFTESLNPEKAVNFGINITRNIESEIMEGTLSADFYRTRFFNQIFPDYDTDPTKAFIENFTGKSVSNSFQAEANLKFFSSLTVRLAYNYLDVYRIVHGDKYLLPFVSKDRVLGSFSYEPASGRWHFDVNMHWFGAQKLPDTELYPEQYRQPSMSETYSQVNAQFTFKFPRLDVYLGCENIFDFRQEKPIIAWDNPFGKYFDTSFIWGPVKGREIYAGIRWRV